MRLRGAWFVWRFVAWGDVGVWSGAAAVEDGGASLILRSVVIGCSVGAVVETVWARCTVNVRVIEVAVSRSMLMMITAIL